MADKNPGLNDTDDVPHNEPDEVVTPDEARE